MRTPQEIDVWYVLPAIRKELAVSMLSKGLKQKDIAKKLGMTEAAVSQYVKNKRAHTVRFPKEIMADIDRAAESMIHAEPCHRFEIQAVLNKIMISGFLCEMHRKYDRDVPACCNVCLNSPR